MVGKKGNLLNLIGSCIFNRHKGIDLNGHSFKWKLLKLEVTQGS